VAYVIERLPGSDVLVVRGSGPGSYAESEEIRDALRAMTAPGSGARVLFDVRHLEYLPTSNEAHDIAESYGQLAAMHGFRMAYLARLGSAQFGIARMVGTFEELFGVPASVFSTEADALAWLAQDGP
jgi:hypothetical protein